MSRRPNNHSRTTLRSTMALLRARLIADEQGATAIEYALIAAGIGAALAATITGLGSAVNSLYQAIAAVL
jgi:pilus assembly protein Flp/PilA